LEFDGERVINSDHITQTLQTVPKSVIILGAGAVGVEFASMYRDFGADVTVVEMLPSVTPLEDKEVGAALARSFTRRGIKVRVGVGARPETYQKTEGGISIEIGSGDASEKLEAEALLVAVGRGGVTQGFGLENLPGVKVNRGLIEVDDLLHTGEAHVYAVGDVVGGYQLAHKAMAEGMLAAEVIAGLPSKPIDRWRVPRATYCRPEIGSMGMSEDQAREAGHKLKIGKMNFAANSRAAISGETEGFCKIISDADTGEILGTFIIGPGATELIGESVLARYLEATPLEIGLAIHAHPSLSEILGEAALDAEGRPLHIAH
ncbi:MAG: FAD-dependent oxidoreductase, partial [Chloroflexi bacterium]|nr:FAD-dependent oxidoreductase [Chloroflexota bacterium]